MTNINPNLIREAPESSTKLLKLLRTGLSWPIRGNIEEVPLIDFSPEELHLDPSKIARLVKIQQIPKLVEGQDFAAFILSFRGGSLPQGAIRQLVARLVRKRRATRTSPVGMWEMSDIIFFCVAEQGDPRLHIVSFRETDGRTQLKVISWSKASTDNRIALLANRELHDLIWGDLGVAVDARDRAFSAGYRQEIRSAEELARQMAEIAGQIRDEIMELLRVETEKGALTLLLKEVQRDLRADLDPAGFADMYAQTMVYGLLAARVAHPENFAVNPVVSAFKFDNPFLDTLYASFRKRGDELIDVDDFGLEDLVNALSLTDVEGLLSNVGTDDLKEDPVVFFYQDFLEKYDPKQRKELGTYYTPIPVVRFMVRAVDQIIKSEFGLSLGVADQTTWGEYSKTQKIAIPNGLTKNDKVIRMIDPATGTGTFLLEWMRQASSNLKAANQFSTKAMESVVQQMDAFEISLSSYAVAHLKTSLELDPSIRAKTHMGIRLTDTLAGRAPSQGNLFNNDPIAREGQLAEQVKFDTNHSVVIGNPPYLRTNRESGGGWLVHPTDGNQPLFDEYLNRAVAKTAFGHTRSLFNLYTYFWRFAMWKAFEQFNGPAVVAYITADSWLYGPGFLGMREVARELGDEIIIVDLGGDQRGARPEEGVFPIQLAVAIVFIIRRSLLSNRNELASVRYRKIDGTRAEKLTQLEALEISHSGFTPVIAEGHGSLVPHTGDSSWMDWPALSDLFPMQQPGCKWARTWPHSPSAEVLHVRWKKFLSKRALEWRETAFVTGKTGRGPNTKVAGKPKLADLPVGAPPPQIDRYSFRSFDRQWAFADERISDGFRPTLWESLSIDQVFLVTTTTGKLGKGPAAVPTNFVPDYHFFCGRGGKDIVPLYRDAKKSPNCDPALVTTLNQLRAAQDKKAAATSPESLFAYCFGVFAGTDYTLRFQTELETPGPRVPLTRDSKLFTQMANFGGQLLWLQTFGERFRTAERKALKCDANIKWSRKPTRIPNDSRDFSYDAEMEVLNIADGKLTGVSKSAWDFEVSGMHVIKKWLGYRTAKGAGRAASSDNPLDKIRPTEWEPDWCDELREIVHVLTETEKLRPQGIKLLNQIMESDLIAADELPQPPVELRKPPSRDGENELFDSDNGE